MFENDLSLEIESNKVYQNEKEKMKMSLLKLHVEKIKWGPRVKICL